MKIDNKEYERLQYIAYNYSKLKETIQNLHNEMISLDAIMEYDLRETEDIEDIEEI